LYQPYEHNINNNKIMKKNSLSISKNLIREYPKEYSHSNSRSKNYKNGQYLLPSAKKDNINKSTTISESESIALL